METMELASFIIDQLRQRRQTVATAESCTGGLLSGALTAVPGCSDVLEMSLVSYSNEVKQRELGVDGDCLAAVGAVSPEVAQQMAEGICRKANAALGLGVTGIAGPGGATPGKPVGLVYIGCCYQGNTQVKRYVFDGSRQQVRSQAVTQALVLACQALNDTEGGLSLE